MSCKQHLSLSMLVMFGAFFVGGWCAHQFADARLFWMFGTGAALAIAARLGFRALLPALCLGCGQLSAFQVGSRPIAYECRGCGHRHDTGVYEGTRRL